MLMKYRVPVLLPPSFAPLPAPINAYFALPTSTARSWRRSRRSNASGMDLDHPKVRTKSHPVPRGSTARAVARRFLLSTRIIPLTTSLIVPSPPQATTADTPWSTAASARASAWRGCSVTHSIKWLSPSRCCIWGFTRLRHILPAEPFPPGPRPVDPTTTSPLAVEQGNRSRGGVPTLRIDDECIQRMPFFKSRLPLACSREATSRHHCRPTHGTGDTGPSQPGERPRRYLSQGKHRLPVLEVASQHWARDSVCSASEAARSAHGANRRELGRRVMPHPPHLGHAGPARGAPVTRQQKLQARVFVRHVVLWGSSSRALTPLKVVPKGRALRGWAALAVHG
eukprot:scaffold624_cov402-Prasinococcus_capsulatus_cf.AAC.77